MENQVESPSDDDDGDGDAAEEEEPKLKYQRLGANVTDILKNDPCTSLAAHEKFIVRLLVIVCEI